MFLRNMEWLGLNGASGYNVVMIVTCPECSAQYLLSDDSIGQGRRVKCTTCEHVWRQEMPPEAFEIVTDDAAVVEHKIYASPDPALLADIRQVSYAVQAPSKKGRMIARILVTAFLLSLVTLGAAALIRQSLVDTWPSTALLFEKLHLPLRNLGQGLVLSEIHFAVDKGDADGPFLEVSGRITNPTKAAILLPDFRVTQKDTRSASKDWAIALHGRSMAAAQTVVFHYELKHALADIQTANIGFAY